MGVLSNALVAIRPVWTPCRLSPSREGFLSAPRQHDLTGTAAALRPQPGGIDPGTVHRRSDKGRPLVRCQLLASEFYENVEASTRERRAALRKTAPRAPRYFSAYPTGKMTALHPNRSRGFRRDESVCDAEFGEEDARLRRISFGLLAQLT